MLMQRCRFKASTLKDFPALNDLSAFSFCLSHSVLTKLDLARAACLRGVAHDRLCFGCLFFDLEDTMLFRTLVFAVLCSFGLPVFASDEVDHSTLSREETIRELAKDLAEVQMTVEAMYFAPQIADHVVKHGNQVRFNVGNHDSGTAYKVRFYTRTDIYVVEVWQYDSGAKSLHINFYRTNQQFGEMSTYADAVADQLIWGTPKIIWEDHLADENADGTLELFQQSVKKDGNSFPGFTREERDLGEKAGVTQELFYDGEVSDRSIWKEPTEADRQEIREIYVGHLKEIAERFGIQ